MNKAAKRIASAILLLSVIIMAFLIRVPSFSEPFNRDEGVYEYMAKTSGSGYKLYSEGFEFKPPGIFYVYAFIQKTFGNSERGLRLFTAIYAIFSTLAIFALASFLYGSRTGLFSAFLFGIFSGGIVLEGNNANSEVFMILPLILGTYAFLIFLRNKSKPLLFLSGALVGIAFLFKIVAIFNLLLFSTFLFLYKINRKKMYSLIILSGFVLVQLPVFLYFFIKGTLGDFVFATFIFGFTYLGMSYDWNYFLRLISKTVTVFREAFLVWVTSITSAVYIIFSERTKENVFLLLWFIFSFFGVMTSGRFYQHYYIQLMPCLSILAGYAVTKLTFLYLNKGERPDIRNYFIVFMLIGSIFLFFIVNYPYYQNYCSYINGSISRDEYQSYFKYRNFPLNYKIATYLKANTTLDDYVYVWGSEPIIYFISERRSPTRYLVELFANKIPGAQDEIICQINQKMPLYIATVAQPFNKLETILVNDYYIVKVIEGATVYKRKR